VDLTPETIQWAASLGVGGLLALGMFLVYRRDSQQNTANWQGQSQMLVQVVKENTAAISALTANLNLVRDLVRERE
jgi:hypothetical protein